MSRCPIYTKRVQRVSKLNTGSRSPYEGRNNGKGVISTGRQRCVQQVGEISQGLLHRTLFRNYQGYEPRLCSSYNSCYDETIQYTQKTPQSRGKDGRHIAARSKNRTHVSGFIIPLSMVDRLECYSTQQIPPLIVVPNKILVIHTLHYPSYIYRLLPHICGFFLSLAYTRSMLVWRPEGHAGNGSSVESSVGGSNRGGGMECILGASCPSLRVL